ncbi:methyl-accepting chemotaxis protein [Pseudoduganella flava]|nr:methyl-accepting chemotaxis protein [Pseudoduganella flava]
MKVGTRLAVGYALVLLLLAIIVGFGLLKMREIQERMRVITDVNNVQINYASQMQDSVTDRMMSLRNIGLQREQSDMQAELARMKKQEDLYADMYVKLGKTFEDPSTTAAEKAFYAKLAEHDKTAAPVIEKIKKLGLANEVDATNDALLKEMNPLQTAWIDTLNELIRFEVKLNDQSAAEARNAYDSAVRLMLILGAIAVAVGIGAATIVTRTLLKQLGGEPDYAVSIATRIADGDLTVDVPVQAGDETSMMAAMRHMRDKLAAIVAEVRSGTDTIATAAAQVSAGNHDLSSRTEEQASSLEETASSMEELTSTVRQNADNAQQASAMAASASDVASQGGAVVAQVVDTMSAIDASAKKIVDIISVIDGIAFQTNILALNAAVEAARAGEQGRGFAVVAGEVRNLAHRAGSAAKEIKALIDDSVEKVGVGTQLVGQAGATMTEVVGSVQRVTDIMSEISAASREQSSGIEQVNQAITSMDEVTQQNAALVEEASAASEAMQEQARKLAELVGMFTLAQGQAAAPAARVHTAAKKPVAVSKPARPALAAAPAPAMKAPAQKTAPRKATVGGDSDWEEF